MKMRAIIIEDEINGQKVLQNLLRDYCSDVELVETVDSVIPAVSVINQHEPDLVFLDIELPELNGFRLFDFFPNNKFETIFTTAYNQYAVKAFRYSAIDYLLKPFSPTDLQQAVAKAQEQLQLKNGHHRMEAFQANTEGKINKICLPGQHNFTLVNPKDIVRCEANGNYTDFILTDGSKVMTSKTLGYYEALLNPLHFFRINRRHLVNLEYLTQYTKNRKHTITTLDGEIILVAEARKNELIEYLHNLM